MLDHFILHIWSCYKHPFHYFTRWHVFWWFPSLTHIIGSRYTLSGPSETSPNLPPCPIHIKGLEFFCRTDNTCVCGVCVETAAHKGHNIVPAKREWLIKKVERANTRRPLNQTVCAPRFTQPQTGVIELLSHKLRFEPSERVACNNMWNDFM